MDCSTSFVDTRRTDIVQNSFVTNLIVEPVLTVVCCTGALPDFLRSPSSFENFEHSTASMFKSPILTTRYGLFIQIWTAVCCWKRHRRTCQMPLERNVRFPVDLLLGSWPVRPGASCVFQRHPVIPQWDGHGGMVHELHGFQGPVYTHNEKRYGQHFSGQCLTVCFWKVSRSAGNKAWSWTETTAQYHSIQKVVFEIIDNDHFQAHAPGATTNSDTDSVLLQGSPAEDNDVCTDAYQWRAFGAFEEGVTAGPEEKVI